MVQRKAARWIENKWQHFLSLTRMTRLMKLRSLEARRHIASLKLLFDVNNELKFVDEGTKPVRQRCTNIKYQRQHARVKVFLTLKISELVREKFVLELEKSYGI